MVGTTAYLVSLTMHRLARARAFVKECLLLCVLIAIKPEEMVIWLLYCSPGYEFQYLSNKITPPARRKGSALPPGWVRLCIYFLMLCERGGRRVIIYL